MGTLFITGEAGSGKTMLVQRARAWGARVALVDLQAPENLAWVAAPASVDVVAVDHATNAITACSPPVRLAIRWAIENRKPLWLVGWDRRFVEWDLSALCIPLEALLRDAAWLRLVPQFPTPADRELPVELGEQHGRRFLLQSYGSRT